MEIYFLLLLVVLMGTALGSGYPVAFALPGSAIITIGLAAITGYLFAGNPDAYFHSGGPQQWLSAGVTNLRGVYWEVERDTLIAIPLFIFMGIMLQRSKIAEDLLVTMAQLFGPVPGGLGISVVFVGALLAATTGIVGATVVAMGLISLPAMLRNNYSPSLATGTIAASGTLGQIIPPSIILIILGDVLGIPVGDLFQAALMPGMVLIGCYIAYILILTFLKPEMAPAMPQDLDKETRAQQIRSALKAIIPPLALVLIVLGSIFTGIATPTESSALGGVGAIVLALIYRQFSWKMLYDSGLETVKVTAMVFAILMGATAFSMAFSYTGGDYIVEEALLSLPGEKWGFIILAMIAILILGFFIDFVEIAFIIVPILAPVAEALGINMVWFAILIAMNLQTSFLTPPFGFSLFYLKGVAPSSVRTTDIYKGVTPFILIQIAVLASIMVFPSWYGMG